MSVITVKSDAKRKISVFGVHQGRSRVRPFPSQAARSPSPADSSNEEDFLEESSELSRDAAFLPLVPKKAKKTTDLSPPEEEVMVKWIQENECLYNKKLYGYKDHVMKRQLWEDKAEEVGKSSEMLQIWYRSLRTRYGRLQRQRSGLTERDQWVLARFAFLKTHLYNKVQRRAGRTLKAKAAAAVEEACDSEEDGDSEEDDEEDVQPSTAPPIVLEVRSKKSTKWTAEEHLMLHGISKLGEQSLDLQHKMLTMLKPAQRVTERTTYADWAKSVMEGLDPSLWRSFQVDHSQLLYRYLGMDDDVKSAAAAQQASLGHHQDPSQDSSPQLQDPSQDPSQQLQAQSQQQETQSGQFYIKTEVGEN